MGEAVEWSGTRLILHLGTCHLHRVYYSHKLHCSKEQPLPAGYTITTLDPVRHGQGTWSIFGAGIVRAGPEEERGGNSAMIESSSKCGLHGCNGFLDVVSVCGCGFCQGFLDVVWWLFSLDVVSFRDPWMCVVIVFL